MNITQNQQSDTMLLSLEGKLDTLTAPELTAAIEPLIGHYPAFILDFTDLAYISSAGLRSLLSAQKKVTAKKETLRIVHCNEMVRSVFKMTKFDQILTIE